MHIREDEYQQLKKYMHTRFGVNLEGKTTLIEGRLGEILRQRGYTNFTDYLAAVTTDRTGKEDSFLVSRLTTNYTYFMREEQHFVFLQKTALPDVTERIRDNDLRIWSAACSTGEEPFSMSMVLMEWFGTKRMQWDTTVLATDISEKVLSIARKGIYSEDKLRKIPDEWSRRYFKRVDDQNYSVSDEMRKAVVFGYFNLMDHVIPFKRKFHIIFCRNVMIYFDNATRQALTNRFYQVLEPGGYLFIGMSETMTNLQTAFEYVQPAVYRKGLATGG